MPVLSLPAALAIYLLFANLLTWFAFRLDKRRAASGGWRFPEANLLALSAAGGWIGAKIAQRQFRHKTRKQPFARLLNVIVASWIALGTALALGAQEPLAARATAALAGLAGPGSLFAPGEAPRRLPHRFGPGSEP
ncbi:DUF1294 domain-containing protein [Cereibacter johrii]|uniref:Uncharacterized membrane protein YsdA (DUF1294 family) n=1 Tax=Cereibacter johrii TaxID=445629 RepID=A0ABX5JCY5_9RHOB|nr:DUF1294 domain-containing protein [Cereibacter johrii]ODM44233.1 hypothetical protein A9O63_01610 [Cereibacter johrii]PTM79620.1 uncharacterized membrane protein YsdA (DUF1294 family) [Cereibacter johrii]